MTHDLTPAFLAVALARAALGARNWDEAADCARLVISELRDLPMIGAHEFAQDDVATLQAVCSTSADATRMVIETMVTDGALIDEVAEHRAMLESLDRCADLLRRTKTLHAVLTSVPASECEKGRPRERPG